MSVGGWVSVTHVFQSATQLVTEGDLFLAKAALHFALNLVFDHLERLPFDLLTVGGARMRVHPVVLDKISESGVAKGNRG